MNKYLLLPLAALSVLPASQSSAAPGVASPQWWPRAKDSAQKEPIVFAQAEPDAQASPEDGFRAGPSDAAIKGRLLYLNNLSPQASDVVLRHFNVEDTAQTRPLWTDFAVFRFQIIRVGTSPSRASLLPNGRGLDLLFGHGTAPDILEPHMASLRWDFDTGTTSVAPDVFSAKGSLIAGTGKRAVALEGPALVLDGPNARSRDHRLWAYWYVKERSLASTSTPPRAALAIASTNPKDEIIGLPVEPSPQQANATWTSRDTLLYDYSVGISSKRNWWYSLYGEEGFDSSVRYTNIPNTTDPLPPHWWPGIYEVDPLPFRRLKSAQGRVLIHNAFAPIPSPDGRFIAFCGWGRDTPVPAPKPGEKPEVEPSEPRWWVWDRTTKKRTLLGQKPIYIEQVKWTPDSRALIFVPETRIKTQKSNRLNVETEVSKAFIEAEKEVPVMRLDIARLAGGGASLEDATSEMGRIRVHPVEYASSEGHFYTVVRMRGLTNDNKHVLVDVREWENRPGYDDPKVTFAVPIDTIHALRLSDKSDQTVAKLEQAQAYDWFDMSQPTP